MGEVVFHVVDTLRIGGAERMAVDLANGLAVRDWDVHLFATRSLGPLADQVDPTVHLDDLARRSTWDLDGLRRFRAAIRTARPAVVHAHGWSSLRFATVGLVGNRHPPALVFHDHRPAGLEPVGAAFRGPAWCFTNGHVAVDPALLEVPLRTRRRAVTAVVANGVRVDGFVAKRDHALGERPRLVQVANLRPQKDHDRAFEAMRLLVDEGIDVTLDLIGATDDAGYLERCEARILALGLTDRVTILGPRVDLAQRLATYDIGVLSSTTESGPIALIEYLAAALPFVVTDVGSIPASLPDDLRTGVVAPGDARALADAIGRLLTLPVGERARLGRRGAEVALDRLSIERTIDEVERVYEDLCGRSDTG